MNILIAMDSFKGSLSSPEAGEAVSGAARELGCETRVFPLADGGEGTVEALVGGAGGSYVCREVTGPLGAPVQARYGILQDRTAVLEMAAAAGLPLVPPHLRDPMKTTTFGVGEMIRDAIDRGCRSFIIGIGGSATNDGGVGMLTALGYRFLDAEGVPISPGAEGLRKLSRICQEGALPQLKECCFRVACDVTNPLCGAQGCSAVFGPQKGATEETIPLMDSWLSRYAQLSGGDPNVPGAGAAGGLGFAFLTFLNARLEPGVQIVLEQTGLEQALAWADIVITGEGKLDGQSILGKAPMGVAALAKRYGKPVVALCGCVGRDAQLCHEVGVDAYFSILPGATSLEAAMEPETAVGNLQSTAQQVIRLLQMKGRCDI